jgi:hypothetical protein
MAVFFDKRPVRVPRDGVFAPLVEVVAWIDAACQAAIGPIEAELIGTKLG